LFEGLKARIERLLAEQTVPLDARQHASLLQEAVVEAKVAVAGMREALARTEGQLAQEQQQLADAERRGTLAAQIADSETMQVAEQFVARHRERIALLTRKIEVQREELRLAEADLAQMTAEWRGIKNGTGTGQTANQRAAWDDLEAAGGVRPETDVNGELLKHQLRRSQLDAAVKAQLDHLKKKMGKHE
jgi:hypothetical protein